MTLTEAINAFFQSAAGQAALGVLIVGVVDLVLGISAAVRDGTFDPTSIAAWLRKHVAGRIFPIWVLLFVGHFTSGVQFADIPLLLSAGIGAAGLYVVETVAGIVAVWGPNRTKQTVPED